MKLTAEPMDLVTKHVFGISRSARGVFENVLVRIEAGGFTGLGEAAPTDFYGEDRASTLEALEAMGDVLEKVSGPFHMQTLLESIDCVQGPCAAAKAAVEMALYDLLGKELDVPLWRMLGLDPSRTPITSFTIGLDDLDVMMRKVEEASEFPLLKVKLNTGADVHVIEAIRAKTSQRIRVDANCAWKPEEAVKVIEKLRDLGVEMIEQPVDRGDIEGLKYVKDNVDVPIFADESVMVSSDVPRLAGAVDGINIKLMKCGGISEALRMIHTARALGLKIMIGCMIESSIAISAAAHLTPLVDAADLDGNLLIKDDPFDGAKVKDGKIVLPAGSGLGVVGRQ
jgi:L-alanine-DL-glutamate epimerase-like enolase superfamily enzyme